MSTTTPSPGKKKTYVGDLNPDQFEIIKELGRGASSYVQLIRDKRTKKSMHFTSKKKR